MTANTPPSSIGAAKGPEESASPLAPEPILVHLVRCDPLDASEIQAALRKLGCHTKLHDDFEPWCVRVVKESPLPDLVVLVGRAEKLYAIEPIRRAIPATDSAPVLVAAAGATVEHAMSYMAQGASGLMLLPASADKLAASLREPVGVALAAGADRRRTADFRQRLTTVTSGEAEVLMAMLQGAANKQIALQLGIGLRTVELRRSKLMKKMNAASVSQLILNIGIAGVDRVPALLNGRKRSTRSSTVDA
ncbi:response regulator transcription factor [Botrimarina hoheduenensis]|uniref:Transcriptional regulatory protein FixJ n=1 Tax=Botrimarina hoheduenensis TaxID=2528000 RepID=A0A5C5W7W1_9BACT|nr:LuxR C-terminal-related transcriptional regulator [Botrimarina hoheduenensis]TWT46537.1 Transcriptional regulatory protein FixJ [Botrimarina hoheduenensis]